MKPAVIPDNIARTAGKDANPVWYTKDATATNVPLYAKGAGCGKFNGVYDITEIPDRILSLMGSQQENKMARMVLDGKGEVSVEAKIRLENGAADEAVMVVAEYKDGILIGIHLFDVSDGTNINRFLASSRSADIKIMLWDNVNGIRALDDAIDWEYYYPYEAEEIESVLFADPESMG